jgi:DNA-directed RNA polymerase specialized sigma24 family protein
VEGLQLDEIAAQLNVSLSTVKRRLGAAEQIIDDAQIAEGHVRDGTEPPPVK